MLPRGLAVAVENGDLFGRQLDAQFGDAVGRRHSRSSVRCRTELMTRRRHHSAGDVLPGAIREHEKRGGAGLRSGIARPARSHRAQQASTIMERSGFHDVQGWPGHAAALAMWPTNLRTVSMPGFVVSPALIFQSVPNGTPETSASW